MTRKFSAFVKSVSLWLCVALIAVYWLFAPLFPADQFLEWLRSAQLSVSLVVMAAYLPTLAEILARRMPAQAQQLVLGVVIAWAGLAGTAVVFLVWRLSRKPEWLLQTQLSGFFIWLTIVGGLLYLGAPRAIDGAVPRGSWVLLVGAVVLSAVVAALVLISPPDASPLAEWLRRYLI